MTLKSVLQWEKNIQKHEIEMLCIRKKLDKQDAQKIEAARQHREELRRKY